MNEQPGAPPFPGAIGVSQLKVYDWEASDGLRGGTPHVHSVCTEAYVVVKGRGAVHTLTAAGFHETPIGPGSFVWFTPGTIHRLINHDGELELFVLMQNGGLPEAGDMILTFPPAVLADPDAYARALTLPDGALTTLGSDEPARVRRDLAVEGYLGLHGALIAGDDAPLRTFYEQAGALLATRADRFRAVWDAGPNRAAQITRDQIDAIARGNVDHLLDASVNALPPPQDERKMGCCGTLGIFVPAPNHGTGAR